MTLVGLSSSLTLSFTKPQQPRHKPLRRPKMLSKLGKKVNALLAREHQSKDHASSNEADNLYAPLFDKVKRHRFTTVPRNLLARAKEAALGVKTSPQVIFNWPRYNSSSRQMSSTGGVPPGTNQYQGLRPQQIDPNLIDQNHHRSALSAFTEAGFNWLLFWRRNSTSRDPLPPFIVLTNTDNAPSRSCPFRAGECVATGAESTLSDWVTTEGSTQIARTNNSIYVPTPSIGQRSNSSIAQVITPSSRDGSPLGSPGPLHIPKRRLRRIPNQSFDLRTVSLMQSSHPTEPGAAGPSASAIPNRLNCADLSSDISTLSSGFITRGMIQDQAIMDRPSYAAAVPVQHIWADLSRDVSTVSQNSVIRRLPETQSADTPTPAGRKPCLNTSPTRLERHQDSFRVRMNRSNSHLPDDSNNFYRDPEDGNADDTFFQRRPRQPPAAPRPSHLSTRSLSPQHSPPSVPLPDPFGSTPAAFTSGLADIQVPCADWQDRPAHGWTVPREVVDFGHIARPQWRRDDSDWDNPDWPRSDHSNRTINRRGGRGRYCGFYD